MLLLLNKFYTKATLFSNNSPQIKSLYGSDNPVHSNFIPSDGRVCWRLAVDWLVPPIERERAEKSKGIDQQIGRKRGPIERVSLARASSLFSRYSGVEKN